MMDGCLQQIPCLLLMWENTVDNIYYINNSIDNNNGKTDAKIEIVKYDKCIKLISLTD